MSTAAKIATCSYCETRVVFSLSGDSRHELVCSSCGAPLENTKLVHQSPAPAAAAKTLFNAPQKKPTEDKQKDEKNTKKNIVESAVIQKNTKNTENTNPVILKTGNGVKKTTI